MSDTIAAVSTGTQVCAIGIVRMSGSKAIDIADRLFSPVSGRKMADCEDRKLIYGKLCDEQGRLLDICLCTISRAPNSYTGEDTAEFQCHGEPLLDLILLTRDFLQFPGQSGILQRSGEPTLIILHVHYKSPFPCCIQWVCIL